MWFKSPCQVFFFSFTCLFYCKERLRTTVLSWRLYFSPRFILYTFIHFWCWVFGVRVFSWCGSGPMEWVHLGLWSLSRLYIHWRITLGNPLCLWTCNPSTFILVIEFRSCWSPVDHKCLASKPTLLTCEFKSAVYQTAIKLARGSINFRQWFIT